MKKNERVWQFALNAYLYFITREGKIDREKMFSVDPRIIPAFINNIRLGDDLKRKLLRMLTNILYGSDNTLDTKLLNQIGGIPLIVEYYVLTRSAEIRDNMFCIIFDYIIHNLNKKKQITTDPTQIAILFELMKRFLVPQYLPQVFQFLPNKFVETFVRFMFFTRLKSDTKLNQIASKLDKTLIVAFLYDLEKLASTYGQLDKEYEPLLKDILESDDIKEENFNTLNTLLNAEPALDRKNGEALLFALMRAAIDGHKLSNARLQGAIEKTFSSLLTSKNPKVRRIYISITEKLILLHKSKIVQNGDESRVGKIFRGLNENFLDLIKKQEKDEFNLIYMFDTIFNLISFRTVQPSVEAFISGPLDTTYSYFLNGHEVLPFYLFEHINIIILYHIFTTFTSLTQNPAVTGPMRVVLLILLIEKCKNKQVLESIGGLPFFKKLLQDRDPSIAYHAARFLVDQLMTEKPDQYRALLNRVLGKAQQTNNQTILENPYLQLKAIMEMNLR